jgi:hypothetical protein
MALAKEQRSYNGLPLFGRTANFLAKIIQGCRLSNPVPTAHHVYIALTPKTFGAAHQHFRR